MGNITKPENKPEYAYFATITHANDYYDNVVYLMSAIEHLPKELFTLAKNRKEIFEAKSKDGLQFYVNPYLMSYIDNVKQDDIYFGICMIKDDFEYSYLYRRKECCFYRKKSMLTTNSGTYPIYEGETSSATKEIMDMLGMQA